MTRSDRTWLTTGQAAELCSVTPATVLNWIRKGRLAGGRTAGGHYRLPRAAVESLLNESRRPVGQAAASSRSRQPLHCWEYFSDGTEVRPECRRCPVHAVRASWCFQVARLDPDLGVGGPLCPTTCAECAYYRRVLNLPTNVLVVTSDRELIARLEAGASEDIVLRFAHNAYEASMVVQDFLPAFAVVDQENIEGSDDGLVRELARDRRLPGLKIVLALAPGAAAPGTVGGWPSIVAAIEKPFPVARIADVIAGFPVAALAADELAVLSQPGRKRTPMTRDAVNALTASQSEDGFLKDMADWDPAMAEALADIHGIGELTRDHWKVIEFVQYYYRTYGRGPPVIRIHKETGLSAADICKLFPCGMVRGAYRLAGLPRPPGCAG